jgi:hypothetical protein
MVNLPRPRRMYQDSQRMSDKWHCGLTRSLYGATVLLVVAPLNSSASVAEPVRDAS